MSKHKTSKPKSETILNKCPDCQNGTFKILDTLVKHTKMGHKSGFYRVQCTLCGFVETVKSKNPQQDSVETPPENMSIQEQKDYNNWLNENLSE